MYITKNNDNSYRVTDKKTGLIKSYGTTLDKATSIVNSYTTVVPSNSIEKRKPRLREEKSQIFA